MSSKKIDKTKENIGVKNLDDHTKKDLFDKFVQAGGQVVNEKKRRGMTDFDRDKQKAYKDKIDAHKKKIGEREPVVSGSKASASKKKGPGQVKRAAGGSGGFGSFFERLSIRFKLLLMGITDFYLYALKPKFLNRMNFEYRSALMEVQMIYLDVFRSNPGQAREIIDSLDKIKPVYFELIERIAGIYERSLVDRILNNRTDASTTPVPLASVKEHVVALLRKLVVLNPHQELLQFAFDRAISEQMRLEKQKASVYARKRKKAKNSVFIIFNKLYHDLYWIFCGIQGRIVQPQGAEIETLLGITDEDRVGSRARASVPKDLEIPTAGAESEEEEETSEMPDHIKKGIEMMFQLDLKKLRADYDRAGTFREAGENDKVLITYLLMQEFDKEYSFILTTNKIKYNVVYASGGKTDYRARLSDIYNEMLKCIEGIRAYAVSLDTFEKLRHEKPASNAQYIEYSRQLTTLEKEKLQVGRTAIAEARKFMGKISEELAAVVADMNGKQGIVDNPQDLLSFNADIEGEKKLDRKKVYEAITIVHQYVSAFSFRLGFEGDLSGNLEFSEEDRSLRTSLAEKESSKDRKVSRPAPGTDKGKDENGKKENDSVLKELDDLF